MNLIIIITIVVVIIITTTTIIIILIIIILILILALIIIHLFKITNSHQVVVRQVLFVQHYFSTWYCFDLILLFMFVFFPL